MTLNHIATGLALAVALCIIAIGARFVIAPQAGARDFGLPSWPKPTDDDAGWLSIKGVRDIVSGLVLVPPLMLGEYRTAGWILLIAALTPLGDGLIVLRHHGKKSAAYGIHGVTALVVAAIACLLLHGY